MRWWSCFPLLGLVVLGSVGPLGAQGLPQASCLAELRQAHAYAQNLLQTVIQREAMILELTAELGKRPPLPVPEPPAEAKEPLVSDAPTP